MSRWSLGTIVAIFGIGLLPATIASGGAEDRDPRHIMEQVYRQDQPNTRVLHATIETVNGSGGAQSKRFVQYRVRTQDGYKSLLILTDPPEVRGLRWLVLVGRSGESQQWIFTPATHRLRALTSGEPSQSVAGTDFTFFDLSAPNLDDFSYRLAAQTGRLRGHRYWQVEAVPIAADRSPYASVVYWVAQDIPCVLAAEMRNAQSQTIKRLDASEFARRDDVWGPRRIEIRSLAAGSRTTLRIDDVRFDQTLSLEMFTPQAMEAAAESVP
jgi:hypothetical protein